MAMEKKKLEQKILAAQSADEVAELMKTAGHEASAEEAAKLFEHVEAMRDKEDRKLDLDELEAVAGGERGVNGAEPYGPWGGMIDWEQYGCAATVEPGSNCWGTDGGCSLVNIEYYNFDYSLKCPSWNGPHLYDVVLNGVYRCTKCHQVFHKSY